MLLPPLSLYVHIPWCIKKCPYCDFNSHVMTNEISEELYINALIKDLYQDLHLIQGRKIKSIFIGGGTPSLFSAKAYTKLLSSIRNYIDIADNAEITMEVNPGVCEYSKLQDYLAIGINRISLGAQSFNNQHLLKLGRIHKAQETIKVVESLQQQQFNNFNIDIMYGLPQQKCSEALADIKMAIAMKPVHISWYELTIEPNTVFYSKPPVLPKEDKIINMQQQGYSILQKYGFYRYEISAFSMQNKESQHNLNYWLFGDYIGIGAGAHSKITFPQAKKITRFWKTRMPSNYLHSLITKGLKTNFVSSRLLNNQDTIIEFFMNALRLVNGVSMTTVNQRTQLNYEEIAKTCSRAVNKGLLYPISRDTTSIKPTARGILFLNELLTSLY